MMMTMSSRIPVVFKHVNSRGAESVHLLFILDRRISFSPVIYSSYYVCRLLFFLFITLLICSCDNIFLALWLGRVNYSACISITTVCNNCKRTHLSDMQFPIVLSLAADLHAGLRPTRCSDASVGLSLHNSNLWKQGFVFYGSTNVRRGTRWRSWLTYCAASRKVAGSIPDGVIGIFYCYNPSGFIVALGLTQFLKERSTRNISWGRGVEAVGA